MNRKKGTALLGAGLVLALATLVAAFAVTHDTADTGELSVESAEQDASADLLIFNAGNTTECSNVAESSYSDDLTGVQLSVADATPGTTGREQVCLRNGGSQPITIQSQITGTTETETACGPDEAAAGDTTCGTGTGELGPFVDLFVEDEVNDCDASTGNGDFNTTYTGIADTAPADFDVPMVLNPDEVRCLVFRVDYDATRTGVTQQYLNQSDQVSWLVRFHAAA